MPGYNATPPPPWGWGPDPHQYAHQFKDSVPVLKLDGPIGQYEASVACFWNYDFRYVCDPIGGSFCARYSNEVPPGYEEAYGWYYKTPLDQSIGLTPCATVGQKWEDRTFGGTLKRGIFEGSAEVMAAQISADTDSAKRFLLKQVGRVMAQAYGVGAVIIGAMIGYRNALSATQKEAESFLALVKPLPTPPPAFQPTPLP